MLFCFVFFFFFFKHKTAYEMRISDWSSDVCSSDLDDFSSLLVSSDNRVQGDADDLKFCGAGALSMDDRENYAVLMRVAMLSSLDAGNTTANLGFRCARDVK